MKQQLPAFVASMKDLVLEQRTEVEKAIIGGGNYKMQQAYQHLEVIDGIWWRMNGTAETSSYQEIISLLEKDEAEALPTVTIQHNQLSVTEEIALQKLNLSTDVVKGMWQKACVLVSDKLSISRIPGGCKKDRYVLSKSGTQPNVVEKYTNVMIDASILLHSLFARIPLLQQKLMVTW